MINNIRASILILCFFFSSLTVFCDDWEFVVTQDVSFYNRDLMKREYLYSNTKIISDNIASYGIDEEGDRIPLLDFIHRSQSSQSFSVNANNVIPAHTKDLFGNDILADKNNFLLSYCIDVLKSGKRETLLEHDSYVRDNQSYFEPAYIRDIYWYEYYDSYAVGFFAFNAVLFFGALYGNDCQALIVNNIEKTEYGYKVRCREGSSLNRIEVTILTSEWSLVQEKKVFDLLVCIDGDYIDFYIDNTDNKLGTFVSVSNEFVNQFNNLIKTNTCNLSNIQWPQRTGDFTPPKEKFKNIEPIATVMDNKNEYEITQKNKKSSLPLLMLCVIIGGIVLVGSVVFFIIKRKNVV